MKKWIVLPLLMAGVLLGPRSNAQSTEGGIPWSISQNISSLNLQDIPLTVLQTPDYKKASLEDESTGISGAYRIALSVPTDVGFENSGKMIFLPDGSKVWMARIKVDGAKAIALDYDQFHLPKGVSLFLKNENGKQILGAITDLYNPESESYSTTYIEGTTTTIELDIAPNVDLSKIKLHVNNALAGYRGGLITDVNQVYGDQVSVTQDAQNRPLDISDTCEVNAVCLPEGTTYEKIRKTAVWLDMGGYVCSGNMINNTAEDCKAYLLTATHCDAANSTVSSHFSTWRFYFNFEYPDCSMHLANPYQYAVDYTTGAFFRARAPYNANSNTIIGDFLLLELIDNPNRIGNQYGAYLAGWDISPYLQPGPYIDFHHPGGDAKKVTVFNNVSTNGSFNNPNPSANTHWLASNYKKGGIEGGSSGSGLFLESSMRLIGDLSGGPETSSPCHDPNNFSVYSKINLNWEYANGDGSDAQKLKPWLDPGNTGLTTMNTIKKAANNEQCGADDDQQTGIRGIDDLSGSISVYPNPTSGIVNLKVNLTTESDLQIEVVNMMGQKVGVFSADKMVSGNVRIDLSRYASGIYLLKIKAGANETSKKVILNR